MIAKLVGFERVEFSGNNGDVKGTRLYVNYTDDRINGIGADMKYFPDDGPIKLPELVIGAEYDFNYQVKGFTGKASLVSVVPVRK